MRQSVLLAAIPAIFLVLVSVATAQADIPEVRPGHDALDATPVRAGSDSLVIFIITEDDALGIGSYHIDTVIENDLITRTERMLGLEGELLWGEEVMLRDGSLHMVSVRALAGVADHVTADGNAVTRTWHEDGQPREQRQAFEAPAFHPGSLDLVLRSLPLDEGYAARIVVLDALSMQQWAVPIHVERAVVISDVHGQNYATWEVHVDLDGAVDVYHLERDTRDLIRYESAADRMVMLRW
jgi:hypothetical protein